jgi:hypothetical protein
VTDVSDIRREKSLRTHDRAAFPNTNGWELFALNVSADGAAIQDRGDKVLNMSLKKACLTDQQIGAMQSADPRCKK